jgi:hypothetical protein
MQDALRSMAMGMLPRQYTQGLPQGTPISQQPTPPMAPLFPENAAKVPEREPARPGWAKSQREGR